jgi:hypothetical protein
MQRYWSYHVLYVHSEDRNGVRLPYTYVAYLDVYIYNYCRLLKQSRRCFLKVCSEANHRRVSLRLPFSLLHYCIRLGTC